MLIRTWQKGSVLGEYNTMQGLLDAGGYRNFSDWYSYHSVYHGMTIFIIFI